LSARLAAVGSMATRGVPQEVYITNSGFLNAHKPESGEARQPVPDPKRHFVQNIRYYAAERIRIQVLNDDDAASGQEV
jgi:hypothetical protein